MPSARLHPRILANHLMPEPAHIRRLVRYLRRLVLATVPEASEAMKFHVLCYYHSDAYFGAIGGNICMIEIKNARVFLSFIHGAKLPDPHHLLCGKGKFKRFLHIPDTDFAQQSPVVSLIRAAADLKPWDEDSFD